jgi:hypothetical protein
MQNHSVMQCDHRHQLTYPTTCARHSLSQISHDSDLPTLYSYFLTIKHGVAAARRLTVLLAVVPMKSSGRTNNDSSVDLVVPRQLSSSCFLFAVRISLVNCQILVYCCPDPRHMLQFGSSTEDSQEHTNSTVFVGILFGQLS